MVSQLNWSEKMALYQCRVIKFGQGIASGREKAIVGLQRLRRDKVLAVPTLYAEVFIRQVRFSAENLVSPPRGVIL